VVETEKIDLQDSMQEKGDVCLPEKIDPTKGSKAGDSIDLGSTNTEVPEGGLSRSRLQLMMRLNEMPEH
jgi:hypothetical protein